MIVPTNFSTFTTSLAETSESPIASPEVIKLASPRLFGTVFNWMLYGVLCVQIYVYSYNFPMDGRPIKFLVYFIFLVETIQTALTGTDVYYWFVAGFGNVEHLENSHFFPVDVSVIGAIVSFIVQGYFCYRIWVLTNQTSWICWIIAVAAVTQSAASIWSIKPFLVEKSATPKTAVYLWAISSALADILIAVAMTLLLRRASSNFSSFVLIRVVRLTIETNTLTATLAIATLVLYVTFPNEVYFVYTSAIFGKVYSNTLLVSLNNRIYLRDHQSPEHGDNTSSPVPGGARAIAETPLHFATPESQPRALKNDIDIFSHSIISQPVDLDDSRGDGTSTDWRLVCANSGHNCSPIPAFLSGSVSLSRHTLGNVINLPKISSGRWACRPILTTERTRCIDDDGYWCGRCNMG